MSDEKVLYEVKGRAAWITINREKERNPLSLEMIESFQGFLDQAEKNPEVRVVCITGAGKKSFCSGMDIKAAFAAGDPTAGAKGYADLIKRMNDFGKPLVARVDGSALGGGMGLMLACDIVYARKDVKIGTPEVNIGLFPFMIGAFILRDAIRKKAMEMIFAGRLLDTTEAEQLGLITRAYPDEEFDEAVNELLIQIGTKAPLACQRGRVALAKAGTMEINEGIDFLSSQLSELIKTEDAMEGMMAFVQKRKPEWKGR